MIFNKDFTFEDYPEHLKKYLSETPSINKTMLFILSDWLSQVCDCFKLTNVVMQRSIELLNRFVRKVNISRDYLQMSGLIAMLISSDLFEDEEPEFNDWLYISDNAYDKTEFKDVLNIFLYNVRLEFDPLDYFNPKTPGRSWVWERSRTKPGERFNQEIAIRTRALVTLSFDYSTEDLSYACDCIMKGEWDTERGIPSNIHKELLVNLSGVFEESTSYNAMTRDLRAKFPYTGQKDNFVYSAIYYPDSDQTGFQLEKIEIPPNILGCGTYGSVHGNSMEGSGTSVVKRFSNKNEIISKDFLRELSCYQVIESKYVAKYIRSSLNRLEIERCKRSLLKFGRATIKERVKITKQICKGLTDIHSKGIIHADLSLSNVMLDYAGNVKIIDFGIAQFPRINKDMSDMVQNLTIRSPEVQFNRPYDHRIDMWSVGALWYFMRYADYLTSWEYTCSDKRRIENRIIHIEQPIKRCLSIDPEGRPDPDVLIGLLDEEYPVNHSDAM